MGKKTSWSFLYIHGRLMRRYGTNKEQTQLVRYATREEMSQREEERSMLQWVRNGTKAISKGVVYDKVVEPEPESVKRVGRGGKTEMRTNIRSSK